MTIDQIVIKDVLRFRGETVLDFDDLDPGIIAVVGPNGAGKTSLLEAVPGTLYRKLPSRRDGADPVIYARSRDAALSVTFGVGAVGAYRARVSLDGQTRSSDAVLEQFCDSDPTAMDGWVPLNDGKVSTYKKVIAERFPSFELFLASAYAAQGKGEKFAQMTPGEGQDLFAEFLGLMRYAAMAKTAKDAVARLDVARTKLTALRDVLTREASDDAAQALERVADELQTTGGEAEIRKATVAAKLDAVATRLATVQDKVSAFVSATARVKSLQDELAGRERERHQIGQERAAADLSLTNDRTRIASKRDLELRDLGNKIAGNEKIQSMAGDIREAVAALAVLDEQLSTLRPDLDAARHEQTLATNALREAEQQIAKLTTVDDRLTRAKTDAGLLEHVPCRAEGPYAACELLVNAQAARARIAELEATLAPLSALGAQVGLLTRIRTDLDTRVGTLQQQIGEASSKRAVYVSTAKYSDALAQSDARLEELRAASAKVTADADGLMADAVVRHGERSSALDARVATVDAAIARLTGDLTAARDALDTSADGHEQARQLLQEQAGLRTAWDETTATIARVENGRRELDRRRAELATARRRLGDVKRKLQTVDGELLEWQTLARAFNRDGLPALEMDAAGPEIAATCNAILAHTFGPRFTLDIVTQIEKAGGKGLKDEFSIRVMDNDEGGDWRDLSDLSGGEKVIVCEALMNAIAVYVNARSPMPIRTLWRDETGSALDAENAVRYVEMLRKVRELGGIKHVFFISHNADAQALADYQIQVKDGRAVVVAAPFTEAA